MENVIETRKFLSFESGNCSEMAVFGCIVSDFFSFIFEELGVSQLTATAIDVYDANGFRVGEFVERLDDIYVRLVAGQSVFSVDGYWAARFSLDGLGAVGVSTKILSIELIDRLLDLDRRKFFEEYIIYKK